MYLLIPKGGMSLVTCAGDLEAFKTLFYGLQGSISNSLQYLKECWNRIQTYLMEKNHGYVSKLVETFMDLRREWWITINEVVV